MSQTFFNAKQQTFLQRTLTVPNHNNSISYNMAGLINTIQTKLGELTTGAASSSKKALLLGAGFVCKPTAQILADAGVEVTIGTVSLLQNFRIAKDV